jgi:hypothetical protein
MPAAAAGEPATVYVLRAGASNMYKVGFTRGSVRRRVINLSTGSSSPLHVVHTVPTPANLAHRCEAFVHAQLHDLATRGVGGHEFFECGDKDALCERVQEAARRFLCLAEQAENLATGNAGAGALEELSDCEVLRGAFEERRRLSGLVKDAELRKAVLEEALLRRFQTRVDAVTVGGRAVLEFPERSQRRLNLERLREVYPEVAAEMLETKVYRTAVFL